MANVYVNIPYMDPMGIHRTHLVSPPILVAIFPGAKTCWLGCGKKTKMSLYSVYISGRWKQFDHCGEL